MATFFKGGQQVITAAAVGGSYIDRINQGATALANPLKVGQDLGYGWVYKVFEGGTGGMVVAKEDYCWPGAIPPCSGNNLFQWSNGSCGTSLPTSTTNGFANTYSLWELTSEPCTFFVGYNIYEDLYVTGSLYAGTRGWYVPAEDELYEVYNSGVLFGGRYTPGDGGYYFSSTGRVILSTPRGIMVSFNTGVGAISSENGDDARVRLVKRI